eukprot:2259856-Rhodomonas_salina.1
MVLLGGSIESEIIPEGEQFVPGRPPICYAPDTKCPVLSYAPAAKRPALRRRVGAQGGGGNRFARKITLHTAFVELCKRGAGDAEIVRGGGDAEVTITCVVDGREHDNAPVHNGGTDAPPIPPGTCQREPSSSYGTGYRLIRYSATSSYAAPTRCPVLRLRMLLPGRSVPAAARVSSGPMLLRRRRYWDAVLCYAGLGTGLMVLGGGRYWARLWCCSELGYGATRGAGETTYKMPTQNSE